MREYNRAYVNANRARHNERNREYRRLRGRGYGTEAKRLRRERRIEHYRAVHRVGVALRRSRQAGVLTIPFTDAQLSDRLSFFGFRCWMCGEHWEHVDHVKPISKGGPHILANLRPACASCNTSKRGAWPVNTGFRLRRALG